MKLMPLPNSFSEDYSIRRLGPGDESILEVLAVEDADFDIPGRGAPRNLPRPDHAERHLNDSHILHWVAEADGQVVAFLYGYVLHRRAGGPEVLFYEIGVRTAYRRRGIGRALVHTLFAWMAENDVVDMWVLADNPAAVSFYRSLGLHSGRPAPVYMCL